ncbi:hypothetical protein C8F04DRAFT_1388514 [Mycena alexandri]|uniref:Uncharacterized protein n=1 Tax=Mycena alexandri TaxID=1745969 RepID=A0AAD6XF53_9AGAR|nr:hypothetical protein C8F04DRAFT_1388514 [Mycena alexandri]
MEPQPLTKSDAIYFATGSTGLSVLSNRIKSRLALRRLQFAAKTGVHNLDAPDEDSEGEDEWSDSESSSSDATPKTKFATPFTRRKSSNLYYWNRPRVELLDLPLEIIEHIATSIRDPKCHLLMDTAALYISDKYSDFSAARFSLSALSQTCSGLRNAVERILYRNIQLDFTGWKGRKHTGFPAGSLRLLLRTLKERPELGKYILIAALDYQLSTESEALERGLEDFLALTPNLTHLFLSQCPVALWDFPAAHLVGFATTFAPGILPSLLEQLPVLQDLHLRDCHVMALAGALPSHKLRRIRLDSSHEYASAHFARVLTICGNSVHTADVRFIGGLQLREPFFLPSDTTFAQCGGGSAIRTLRLDNISVLAHLSSGYAHLLQELPALEHLHLSHHAPFASDAFSMLPDCLQSLTVSAYYGLWTAEPAKTGFLPALASCISISMRETARVEGSRGARFDEGLDLQPLMTACKTERILCENVEAAEPFVTVFFGTKVPCVHREATCDEGDEDDDPDDEASFKDVLAAIPTRVP